MKHCLLNREHDEKQTKSIVSIVRYINHIHMYAI